MKILSEKDYNNCIEICNKALTCKNCKIGIEECNKHFFFPPSETSYEDYFSDIMDVIEIDEAYKSL